MKGKRVVSRGSIKVDARRAVAKLREHLLLDPDAWPLEVVRVAAMCGATGVSVEHDADDLRIAFDGMPPASGRVARLLDFALESSRDPAVRALRLLAIALNATISTGPRRVTVAVRDDAGGDARFVFDPTLHERAGDGGGASAQHVNRTLERMAIARDELGGASVVVEMNKGFSWGTFVRFASQRPLREVLLLQEATRRCRLPISFSPELPSQAAAAPVMIVSLEEHGVPGGVLEVRADVGSGPRIAFLEYGVVLADVALPSSPGISVEGHGVHLPIDVHVDAETWPTNASRSQVQARLVARVVDAVHAILPAIGRALGLLAQGGDIDLVGVVTRPTRAEAERAAGAFACCAARGDRDGPLGPMLDLPLARDATGRAMSVERVVTLARRALESAGAERVYVHRATGPLPEAFAPFAADVVWLGGSLVDRILAGVHTRDFADVHRDVGAGIARREAWLRQPATGALVPSSATELVRLAFDHSTGDLAGLRGEVVVHVGRREPPGARIYVEDRLLASVPLDGTLPIEAALSWPARLRPTLSFDAVVNDASLHAALHEVARLAVTALAERYELLGAPDASPATRALGRAALAADPSSRRGPLARAPLWPTISGGWLSLAAIGGPPDAPTHATSGVSRAADIDLAAVPSARARSAPPRTSRKQKQKKRASTAVTVAPEAPTVRSTRSIAIAFVQRVPEQANAGVPGGRVVLVLDALDAQRLQAALERDVVLVPFGPALGRVDDGAHRPVGDALQKLLVDALVAQGADAALVVSFEDGPVHGLCATAIRGRMIRTFAGVPLREDAVPSEVPAIVVLEDARAVPTPKWDGLLDAPPPPAHDVLVKLARAVCLTLEADATEPPRRVVPLEHVGIAAPSSSFLRSWLLAALGSATAAQHETSELHRTLVATPCIRVVDEHGMPVTKSLDEVRRIHPGAAVPYLEARPDFATGRWQPLLLRSRGEAVLLERALGAALKDGTTELARRRELHELENTRQRIMAQPSQSFAGPIPGALASSPVAASKVTPRDALRALVALRAAPADLPAPCTLRYGGRHVTELTLGRVPPQIAVLVDTTQAKHVEKWAGLSSVGREAAISAASEAAEALVATLVGQAAGLAFESTPLGSRVGCELVCSLLRTTPAIVSHLQASSVTLESAFGGRIPLSSAWSEGPTPIARGSFPAEMEARVAQVPILLEARHAGLEQLLQSAGLALRDITRALTEATGQPAMPARLGGSPVHPALRATFIQLGIEDLEGELEIATTEESGIEILVLGDAVRTAAPDLPFGVRAVARPRRLDTRPKAIREVAVRIGKAAMRHLEALARAVEDLPPTAAESVRACARACVRRAVEAEGKPSKALAGARAFIDVGGRAWSLEELLHHRIRFTTAGPPYPATALSDGDEPSVVPLEERFAAALRKLGTRGVFDVTRELRLDAEAEARALAPPEPARLSDDLLRGCFAVADVAEGSARGQVGLLVPARGAEAYVAVHVDGRPVCTVGLPSGWPVVAVIDDASLQTNRRRDGLAPTSQADLVTQRVIRHRAALLASRAIAPTHAFAEVSIARSLNAFEVAGRLWLEEDDPRKAGTVSVFWSGRSEPGSAAGSRLAAVALTLEARDGIPTWPRALPISGTLFVSPKSTQAPFDGAARSLLGSVAVETLVALLARPGPASSAGLERWRWAAAMWGAPITASPARDTSGAAQSTSDVLRELRRRGVLWSSRHAGVADGDFPDEAPSFILLDDGDVDLLDLLGSQAPALLRELGSLSSTPEQGVVTSTPEDSTPERITRKRRHRKRGRPARRSGTERAQASRAVPDASRSTEAAELDRPSSSTWIARMESIVAELTGSKDPEPLDRLHPLVVAVAAAADRLGHPMPQVVVGNCGRPITYLARKNVIRVHLEHEAVAALLERGEVELLTAAAFGELNRALEAVSDAEEARGVVALLERRHERQSG